jgi:hypothetical protein
MVGVMVAMWCPNYHEAECPGSKVVPTTVLPQVHKKSDRTITWQNQVLYLVEVFQLQVMDCWPLVDCCVRVACMQCEFA